MRLASYGTYHHQEERIVNGAIRVVDVFNFPPQNSPEINQEWLLSHGWGERQAYMIAFNVSEQEMQRIEND